MLNTLNFFKIFIVGLIIIGAPCSYAKQKGSAFEDLPEPLGMKQAKWNINNDKNLVRIPVSWKVKSADKEHAQKAWERIFAYVKDKPSTNCGINVVYVTYKNSPAYTKYRERYDQILKTIQVYFADQMQANGYPPLTFSLDLDKERKVIIHEVFVDLDKNDVPSEEMMGNAAFNAIRETLHEKNIDISSTHTLVISSLAWQKDFHGFGRNGEDSNENPRMGIAWIFDSPWFNISDIGSYAAQGQTSLGLNISERLGVIAHELGHTFSLGHGMADSEYFDSGLPLMSLFGPKFGDELRGGKNGVFLLPVAAAQLASNPLFNGFESSSRIKLDWFNFRMAASSSNPSTNSILLGSVKGAEPPIYAAVAYLSPMISEKDDYNKDYYTDIVHAFVDKEGNFSMDLNRPNGHEYARLTVKLIHANGVAGTPIKRAHMWVNEGNVSIPFLYNSRINFQEVSDAWNRKDMKLAKAILEEKLKKEKYLDPFTRDLAMSWENAVNYETPRWDGSLSEIADEIKKVDLTHYQPQGMATGHAIPCWNTMLPAEIGIQPFFIKNYVVKRFILIHAIGYLTYNLEGKWERFKTTLGLPLDRPLGTIQWVIKGDDKILFSSNVLKVGDSVDVDISVKNVHNLKIELLDAGDGIAHDWGIIANPVLLR